MTGLTYLENTYLFETTAIIRSITDSDHGVQIILDHTIFHPQGGGQPSDVGIIESANGSFTVKTCRIDANGNVCHFGEITKGTVSDDETVTLKINHDVRLLHARLHSARHLIDIAVRNAGLSNLKPTKGYHFSNGANVEYEGSLEDANQWLSTIEKLSNELVTQGIAIHAKQLSTEQAASMGFSIPDGKSSRFVWLDSNEADGCGCGGTHLQNSNEIGEITIRKIKSKKGITKISYALQ